MPIKVTQLSEYTSTIAGNSNVVFLIVDTDSNVTKKVKANNIQFSTVGSGFTGSVGSIGYTGSQGIPGISIQGFTGSAGTTGFTGSLGSLGYTGSSGLSELTIDTKTNSYLLSLSDASKVVNFNSSVANTVTVPSNANVAFGIGTQITILQSGSGNVTIANQNGVVVYSRLGLKLAGQWAGATIIKTATDSWVAIGDLNT